VLSTIFLLKSLLVPEYQDIVQHGEGARTVSRNRAHVRNILRDPVAVVRFGLDRVFRVSLAKRKLPYTLVASSDGTYPLEFNSEQIPREESHISLNDKLDRYGIPGVHVDWRICDEDIQGCVRAFHLLREAIAKTKTCSVEFDDRRLPDMISSSIPIGGHHIGTARMGPTARDGVVDPHCAVYGVPNLYVSGSAVFPTSSHANPTLTIVAMAIRLAAHLKDRGRRGELSSIGAGTGCP
jgi:choline dehydrogenase-like flavoprotein